MTNRVKHILEAFFSQFPTKRFKKGDSIIRASDPIESIYFLRRGLVRQYLITQEGDDISLHLFKPGSFFPIMLLLSNVENKYYFEAITAVETSRAPADKVLRFIKNEPEILFDLTTRFATGLMGMLVKNEQGLFTDAYKKVLALLLYLCERFGDENRDGTAISLSLTHSDIGSWIGLRRETVSRQMEKLQKKGLVQQKNRTLIIASKEKLLNEFEEIKE